MIDMVIPTGAMGNLTGGYMAKKMGVSIGRLCAGVNINGEYSA
jgi:threonine synthase